MNKFNSLKWIILTKGDLCQSVSNLLNLKKLLGTASDKSKKIEKLL